MEIGFALQLQDAQQLNLHIFQGFLEQILQFANVLLGMSKQSLLIPLAAHVLPLCSLMQVDLGVVIATLQFQTTNVFVNQDFSKQDWIRITMLFALRPVPLTPFNYRENASVKEDTLL